MTEPQGERAGIELRAEGLRIAYQDFVALRIPKLQLEGQVIAIIGHNGSGKSTLIKTILQLLTPRDGSIALDWRHEGGRRERLVPEEHMAFSPENGAVFADISVRDYIQLWCRIKQGDPGYYKKAGAEFIERLHISSLLSKLGRELSKGQRRRVQIAVGFLTRPRVFLFDEPFDGLDVQQANELGAIMTEAAREMALFVSSHRMDVVERLSDQVIVLKQGEVLTAGPLETVCEALCEQSIVVTLADNAQMRIGEIVRALRKDYPSSLIHHVGKQLVVSGRNIKPADIAAILTSSGASVLNFETVRPSLIDAMNYHLNHFAQEQAAVGA